MQRLPIKFESYSPDVDESHIANESRHDLAIRLSKLKALAGAKQFPGHICIGSDQVSFIKETKEYLGKPKNKESAILQLEKASDKTICFYSGLCMYYKPTEKIYTAMVPTEIKYRKLSREHIERYLEIEQPYHCAASLKSEGYGISICEKISSDDPTAVMGLPLITLINFLRQEGVPV